MVQDFEGSGAAAADLVERAQSGAPIVWRSVYVPTLLVTSENVGNLD